MMMEDGEISSAEASSSLPEDVWNYVLSFLSMDTLVRARCVHPALRQLVNSHLKSQTDICCSFLHRRIDGVYTDAVVTSLFQIIMEPAGVVLEHLTYLDFAGLHHFTGLYANGSSSFMADVFVKARNLLTLDCSGCIRFTPSALSLPQDAGDLNLKNLYLTGCRRLGSESIGKFLKHCPLLEELHICGISSGNVLLDKMDRSLKERLRSLDVSEVPKPILLDETCASRLESLQAANCRSFRSLDFEEFGPGLLRRLRTEGLTWDVSTPSKAFRKLRHLDLNDLTCSLEFGFVTFIALQSRQLVEVHLSDTGLRDDEVHALALSCGSTLKVADFQCCDLLSDRAFVAVQYCPHLVDLRISACFALTDESIFQITTHCRKLRCLRMAHLNKITDHALEQVGQNLQQLLLLDVKGCTQLSRCTSLPKSLIELDKRSTCIAALPALPSLAMKCGRSVSGARRQMNSARRCAATWQSQFCGPTVDAAAMWGCRDCDLVSSRGDKGMCGACAMHCHRGHDTYLLGRRKFFCDCAFGLGRMCDCRMLNIAQGETMSQVEDAACSTL